MSEAIAEQTQNTANPSQGLVFNDSPAKAEPSSERKPWHFTSDKAREANRKSVEARRKQGLVAAEAIETLDKLKLNAVVLPVLEPDEVYRLSRLKATREALDGLYSDLNGADDPKDQKAICDSIARLSEVERLLAGRPSPGSHRPTPSKPKRTQPGDYGPVE